MVRGCSIGCCQLLLLDCLNTITTYYIVITTISLDFATAIIVNPSLIRHSEITIARAVDCVSFDTEVLRLHWLHTARVRLGWVEILQ